MVENGTTRFTEWHNTTTQTSVQHLFEYSTVEIADLQTWGDTPDMLESNRRKFTSPIGGHTDATEEGADLVTKSTPAVEACIRQFPHTVNTVSSFWFSQNILELDLKY